MVAEYASPGIVGGIKVFLADQAALLGTNIVGCAFFGIIAIISSKLYLAYTAWQEEQKELAARGLKNEEFFSQALTSASDLTAQTSRAKLVSQRAELRRRLDDAKFEQQRHQAKSLILKADLERIKKENEQLETELDKAKDILEDLVEERQETEQRLSEITMSVTLTSPKKEIQRTMEKKVDQIERTLQENVNHQQRMAQTMAQTKVHISASLQRIQEEQAAVEQDLMQHRAQLDASDVESHYPGPHTKEHSGSMHSIDNSSISDAHVVSKPTGPMLALSAQV